MNFIITTLLMSCCMFAVVNCGDYIQVDGRTYYSSYPDQRNWFQAKRFCTYNGMYLVDVRTDAENKRILSVIKQIETKYNAPPVNWWTSGTDRGSQNSFYWDTTGHEMLYMNWHTDQPDNKDGEDDCVNYNWTYDHEWDDGKCETEMSFICRDRLDISTGPSNCLVAEESIY